MARSDRSRPYGRPAQLDTVRPRWDDAAQGGAADGASRELSEPSGVRGRCGSRWPRAAGGVWAVAGAGAAGVERPRIGFLAPGTRDERGPLIAGLLEDFAS